MKPFTLSTTAAVLVALILAISIQVQAHHSHAMFDGSKVTELVGTVSAVRFGNPHVYLQLRVTERDGAPVTPPQVWAIEMSTIQNMTQRGVTPNIMPAGTTMTVRVNPLFSGQPSGNYTHIVSINGVRNTSTDDDWKPAAR
jgi:hypothetical protein